MRVACDRALLGRRAPEGLTNTTAHVCSTFVPRQAAFLNSDAGQRFVQRLPRRRVGAPSDLDGPLLLLAGEGGAFMTGSSVLVDDGQVFGL